MSAPCNILFADVLVSRIHEVDERLFWRLSKAGISPSYCKVVL